MSITFDKFEWVEFGGLLLPDHGTCGCGGKATLIAMCTDSDRTHFTYRCSGSWCPKRFVSFCDDITVSSDGVSPGDMLIPGNDDFEILLTACPNVHHF